MDVSKDDFAGRQHPVQSRSAYLISKSFTQLELPVLVKKLRAIPASSFHLLGRKVVSKASNSNISDKETEECEMVVAIGELDERVQWKEREGVAMV